MKNKRLEKFKETLKSMGIDGALVYNDANRNYLSYFTGNESYAIITYENALFITDSRYTEQAKMQVEDFEVKEYRTDIYSFIKDAVASLRIKKLGFEENYMTYNMYDKLRSLMPEVEFVPLNRVIEKQRQIKDENEIENIRSAAKIADDAFLHMLKFIKAGMSEYDVGIELEFFMRKEGASALSFPSIVASGKRSSLPHGTATQKIINAGDFLTLDYGCIYNGYCSDMTRTIVIGKASQKQKEIYDIVLHANEEVLKDVKPGILTSDLDKVARDIIGDHGYGKNFGHGLGHGVGMEIHELPRVSKTGNETLRAGMVITDEPGIYLPDFGGGRIEDLVLVTEDGCDVISKSDKKLIELD